MVKLVFAGMATVAVSAVGATAMVPTHSMAAAVLPVAAIDDSSSTIGFSDTELYFMTPAQVDAQLDQMQALGVNDVRVVIPWAGVEPLQGYYNWSATDYMVQAADARGMGVLGVLAATPQWAVGPGGSPVTGRPASPAAYGDFAGIVAARYAGKVGAYEIWNEPNGAAFYSPKPDPAGYTDLLKAAYPAIKAADPDATVIGGVVGAGEDFGDYITNPVTFVRGIYAAGGEQYFDALSYHPYQYTTPFSQGGYLAQSPINQVAAIRDLMVANGDSSKLIWATEYGEPTAVASEADQAAYLQDMLTTWRTLGYTGPSFVYTVQDRSTGSTDPEDTFGVIRTDGTLKPAAYVIQALASSSTTTPAMARMALAMPEASTATPADLAALTKVAESTDTAAETPLTAETVTAARMTPEVAAAQMATATAAATTAVAASVASLNPLAVAATTLAAAGQLATMTVQEVAAMAATAMTPPSATVSATAAATSPAAPAATLATVPAGTSASETAAAAKVGETTGTPTTPDQPKPAKVAAETPRQTKVNAPRVDTPKDAVEGSTDTPKVAVEDTADAPKDAPKGTADAPKSDTPKADAPKADAPKRAADRSADRPARSDRNGSDRDRSHDDRPRTRQDRQH